MNPSLNPSLTTCPACSGVLTITRLRCARCDLQLEGRFSQGPLAALSPQQLAFVAAFVRCEGKLSHLEAELGLSYPTLRSRLQEVVRALRAEPQAPAHDPAAARRREVLAALEAGHIDAREAIGLLEDSGEEP